MTVRLESAGLRSFFVLLLSLIGGGCGIGTAGILAGVLGGRGGGGGAGSPQVAAVAVAGTKFSPAIIAVTVFNPGGARDVDIDLFYRLQGSTEDRALRIGGVNAAGCRFVPNSNRLTCTVSERQATFRVQWPFASEDEFKSGDLVRCVVVKAVLDESPGPGTEGVDVFTTDIGNKLPKVSNIRIRGVNDLSTDEVGQVAQIEFTVEDSTIDGCADRPMVKDLTFIQVEYDLVGDGDGFCCATELGEAQAANRCIRLGGDMAPTPRCLAFGAIPVEADADGETYTFVWDVLADLLSTEQKATIRITPFDAEIVDLLRPVTDYFPGTPGMASGFRIDNNQTPIGIIGSDSVTVNPDRRRGLPVPFQVRDGEGDLVSVVFQWAVGTERFPSLFRDESKPRVQEIRDVLADPGLRREKRIATEAPLAVGGQVVPVPDGPNGEPRVGLPEIADAAAMILGPGGPGPAYDDPGDRALLADRVIEILRPPTPASAGLGSRPDPPLSTPAALPIDDGERAFLLERTAPRSWRVRATTLATGLADRPVAESSPDIDPDSGEADLLVFEPGERTALVADENAGRWRVLRVDLYPRDRNDDGVPDPLPPVELVRNDGFTETGPLRALVSVDRSSALATVGASLVRLEYGVENGGELPGRAATLIDGLVTPWGLAIERSKKATVYVAERDYPEATRTGRISEVDVDTLRRKPLFVSAGGSPGDGIERPESLAIESPGNRLLFLSNSGRGDGTRSLRAIDLGGRSGGEVFALLDGIPGPATDDRPAPSLSSGPEAVRLVAIPQSNDVLVGNGVSQRRTIRIYDPKSRVAAVDLPFDPPLSRNDRWRIFDRASVVRAERGGTPVTDVFVWDTGDVPQGGDVRLRLIAFDTDVDAGTSTRVPRPVLADIDVAAGAELDPGGTNADVFAIAAADLDGDGLADIAQANLFEGNVSIFRQKSPGVFCSMTSLPVESDPAVILPYGLELADIDGDTLCDVAVANQRDDDEVTIFFQSRTNPGTFEPGMSLSGRSGKTGVAERPQALAIADVFGDERLDIVVANFGAFGFSGDITVFEQNSLRGFRLVDEPVGAESIVKPLALAIADVNGDGRPDVVSANGGRSRSVTAFLNDSGSESGFDPEPIRVGSTNVRTDQLLSAGDLDGDGLLDLVLANGAITAFFQRRSPDEMGGLFDGVDPLDERSAPPNLVSPTLTDMDGDGDDDIVVASTVLDLVATILQTAPRRFDPRPIRVGAGQITDPSAVGAADLDGDGTVDLFAAGKSSADGTKRATRVFLQARGRELSPDPLVLGRDAGVEPNTMAAGDLDRDGDVDLVSVNRCQSTLSLFFQASPSVFPSTPSPVSGTRGSLPFSAALADIDGDGAVEILSANEGSHDVSIFKRNDSGAFELWGDSIPAAPNGRPRAVATGDIDGNQTLDVVVGENGGNAIRVFLQSFPRTDPPTFVERLPALVGSPETPLAGPESIAVADLNDDGRLDVVSANNGSSNLTVFFQSADGRFVLQPGKPLNGPFSVAAGDVDLDGRVDVVATDTNSHRIAVYFQDSTGGLGDPVEVFVAAMSPRSPQAVAIGDVDADGLPDVGSANGGDNLTLFLQAPGRRFPYAPLVVGSAATTDSPFSIVLADVDGDGDLDVASANRDSMTLAVFFSAH